MGSDEARLAGAQAASAVMLRRVLEGATYDAVAADFGVTRTAVERRVKALACRVCRKVGVPGFTESAAAFVSRLRAARPSVLHALDQYLPLSSSASPRSDRIVTPEEIARGAALVRSRSRQPWRDVALFYMPFVTGARPLEVARMCVRDYLAPDGSVRRQSELPAEASISGRVKPLHFASARLDEALQRYLEERARCGHGTWDRVEHRGLDPASRLFLTPGGAAFRIVRNGGAGARRSLCRPILETYRKLFRYADIEGMTVLLARRTLAARLYERGADERQVGLVLGVSELSAVRALFPRLRREVADLVVDLV